MEATYRVFVKTSDGLLLFIEKKVWITGRKLSDYLRFDPGFQVDGERLVWHHPRAEHVITVD